MPELLPHNRLVTHNIGERRLLGHEPQRDVVSPDGREPIGPGLDNPIDLFGARCDPAFPDHRPRVVRRLRQPWDPNRLIRPDPGRLLFQRQRVPEPGRHVALVGQLFPQATQDTACLQGGVQFFHLLPMWDSVHSFEFPDHRVVRRQPSANCRCVHLAEERRRYSPAPNRFQRTRSRFAMRSRLSFLEPAWRQVSQKEPKLSLRWQVPPGGVILDSGRAPKSPGDG